MNTSYLKKIIQGKKIIIFHDELSIPPKPDETDIIKIVSEVAKIIENFGATVKTYPFLLDLTAMKLLLKKESPVLAVNLVDSIDRKCRLNYLAPALLEAMEIPYTGCNLNALFLVSDKLLSKDIMEKNNIATASWVTETSEEIALGTYIVKSSYEHASIGIEEDNVVSEKEVLEKIKERKSKFGGKWFAEKYIDGREFEVPIVEIGKNPQVLAITEVCYPDYPSTKRKIFDYDSKWNENSFGYNAMESRFEFTDSDSQLIEYLKALGLQCWEAFGLSGYARVDIRVDGKGKPFVLEINANPSLGASPDAFFLASAEKAKMTKEKVIANILMAALEDKVKYYAET